MARNATDRTECTGTEPLGLARKGCLYLESPSVHIRASEKHHGAVGFGNGLCQLAPAMPGASFIQVLVKLQTLKSVHIMNPDISGHKG